jgi:hypothetical protein
MIRTGIPLCIGCHIVQCDEQKSSHKSCRAHVAQGSAGSPKTIALLYSCGGTKSTKYCGHFWPIVQAPDHRWGRLWSNGWNEHWQGKQKYSEKTCPSATLSTTNPTWPDPGRRGGKPETNRLSYGAACITKTLIWCRLTTTIRDEIKYKGKKLKCIRQPSVKGTGRFKVQKGSIRRFFSSFYVETAATPT